MVRTLAVFALAAALLPESALAQAPTGPVGALELTAGHAGFVDDATRHHSVFGGSARYYLGPRISIGPEVVYMRGPGGDRDLFVTGNVTFDLAGRSERTGPTEVPYGRPPRVIPFVVVGAGLMRHSDRFGATTYPSSEGALTGGGGVRGRITDRVFVAGEFRLGWELHARTTATVGWTFGK